MPWPFTTSHSWVTRDVGFARILATVSPSRNSSPSSTQFSSRMLSTRELMAYSPAIDVIPKISGFS